MTLPVGLPQEIWDEIVDLVDDHRDLRSCASVSRALRPRAQTHLFRDINLAKPRYHPFSSDHFDDGAACRRLVLILAASPHLARYIRRIHIPFRRDFLIYVCGMRLSRLYDVGFSDCPKTHFSYPDDPSFATLDLAHGLIALPSIRTVRIEVQKWPFKDPGPGFTFRLMNRLFQDSTQHIENLTVNFLGLEKLATPELAVGPCASRARIKSLTLMLSPQMGDYLLRPECPFNLARLEDVQIFRSANRNPAVKKALEYGRFTVKRLECNAEDLAGGLKLERFPFLTHLQITGTTASFPVIKHRISNAGEKNCIETVILIFENGLSYADDKRLKRLDAVLSSSVSMPALQKVEIRLAGFFSEMLTNVIRSSCRKLSARGMLDVSTTSNRWWDGNFAVVVRQVGKA
ncbi:hypothetical protein FB451DRAFT_1361655 [Mycena latifolia]|nr:hypothetical protein FB451DRAFT_1361655 [Mycena latifolia]